ncbi:MAG TPA: hypothetical protein VGX97_03680 [bacterium]|nr:hypothetical protein [bacterium]
MGIDTVILGSEKANVYDPAVIGRWGAELVPALRGLPVAGRGGT